MWLYRVFLSVLCLSVAVWGQCRREEAERDDFARPWDYWDTCSPALPERTRQEYVKRLVDTLVEYHYDVSHGLDNFKTLKRINVTEVTLLAGEFRRQKARGGTNKRTTFSASGFLGPHYRMLEFSVRLFPQ
ncbi:envelope protein UL131A [Panine betaherpesvirus 2]|uniref:Envelope protein UL131A n=1 Tax=Panine betaherpesvirus 2 TaxID=188763 RepID=Q8QRY2_9BETA|nr:envelope protein UL131A [Panine betaherpesvirus 2]AAM00756.1 envelope protein UL131A [Panine betaherpesvirus 2]QXV67869.1 envelope protein UL131A [Panine betaherpesvirus 2]